MAGLCTPPSATESLTEIFRRSGAGSVVGRHNKKAVLFGTALVWASESGPKWGGYDLRPRLLWLRDISAKPSSCLAVEEGETGEAG